jgi:hypothetical protein
MSIILDRGYIRPLATVLIVAATFLLMPVRVSAQLSFGLDSVVAVGNRNSVVTYTGNLVNSGNAELFLNGINFNFDGGSDAFLTGDGALGAKSVFFNQVPFSLAPAGQTGDSYTGPIFAIQIEPSAPLGTYQSQVTIQGGVNPGSLSALGTQNVQVNVTPGYQAQDLGQRLDPNSPYFDPVKNGGFRLDLTDPYNDSLVITNIERLLEQVRSGAMRFDEARFREMYERIREFSRFWQPGFHGATGQTAYHLFLTGRAAVLLETSATVSQLLKDMNNLPERLRFPWGVFPVPPMKRTRFSVPPFRGVGGAGTSLAVVKKSPKQVAASVDFLMCLASPRSAKILVQEAVKNGKPLTGPMLIPGAPIPEQVARHFRAFENRGFEKMSFRGLADEQESVWEWTVWAQRFMEGRITLDEFLARYQKLMRAAVPRVIALQKLDMNPRTKDAKG